jgi:hypothetical protein
MFVQMFMPSTPVVLFAIAVLAVLVILAWFVRGTARNRSVAPRRGADSPTGDGTRSIENAVLTKKAA